MAEAYKIWDHQRAVILANKLLCQGMTQDHTFLRHFQWEGKTLAGLLLPNKAFLRSKKDGG
jgi:hypothetical protein